VSQQEYFQFVQTLAEDLNGKHVKLPSFPDVVMRIRAALDDPDTTPQDIENILHTDAVLASRVLILANSAFHNPSGIRIENLHAAISRIGFAEVRSAAISYALEQLYSSKDLAPLKDELRKSWSAGLNLAALAESIAKNCTSIDEDGAFVAGLLNRIGVLYIFSKYNDYPSLLKDTEARDAFVEEWAAPIGESIVSNWDFSEEIQKTLNPNKDEPMTHREEANLADVIATAKLSLAGDDLNWPETAAAKRLHLTPQKMAVIIDSYQQRIDSLTTLLR
jgi:HD-like signal output (HDOD) protein